MDMAVSPKHIAILFHKQDRHRILSHYIVHHLAEKWRMDGHEVHYLFGPKRYVPADLIMVHVNLSVVPDDYLKLAARYPISLNGRVRDIRKTAVSRNLLQRGDGWEGPVIVKSDLNYAGHPEKVFRRTWLERRWRPARRVRRLIERVRSDTIPFSESIDYCVFDRFDDVPDHWFGNRHVVVEKFRPELEKGLYHVRMYQFLGDRWTCTRVASTNPIVKAESGSVSEEIKPHAEVVAWREEFGLDYGKIDYVINDGEVVLLDANKTTGASNFLSKEKRDAMRRYRADGLYSYFSS